MNKNNIETTKIKVNNGQELIQKAQEYKNSGGEWKLREKYNQLPNGTERDKKELGWGIIISNGEQTVDIFSTKNSLSKDSLHDEIDARPELFQLFPETKSALFSSSGPMESLDISTFKLVKKASGEHRNEYNLHRYLVAENAWHLTQIVHQWVQENKTAIQQSPNSDFASWVEIIDGQDGNMYLYVGKKNDDGGREIKIRIKKDKYFKEVKGIKGNEKYGGGFYNAGEELEINWDLMLITIDFSGWPLKFKERKNNDQPIPQAIKEKLLRNLDKISIEQCGYLVNAELVKNYEQIEWYFRKGIFGDDNNQKWKAWWDKVQKVEIEGEEIDLEKLSSEDYWEITQALIDEVKQNPSEWKIEEKKHNHWTEKMVRHQKSGWCHWKSLSNARQWKEIEALINGSKLPDKNNKSNNKNNQLKDSEKSQILSYFIAKNISKVSLENGKLTIEYNNHTKKTIENEDQELAKYHQYIQNLPSKSLSLSDLQNNNTNNHSTPDKSNIGIYIGLTISVLFLGGIFIYFLVRKKKK